MKQLYFLLFFCMGGAIMATAQTGGRQKMAIFTPFYIDEAFDAAGSYQYSGKSFPKHSINGLEFYHGAALAIDSLNKLGLDLDVYVYDSKSKRESLEQQFSKCAADGVGLIIANCSAIELATLARLGRDKKITVINATVPNDGNTADNPFFVVMNPTIQTQLEGLYQYIKTQYGNRQVTVITRKGSSEKYIRTVLETLNTHYKKAINFNFREVNDEIALKALGTTTQPSQAGFYVVGSLDTEFGIRILEQFAAQSKNYGSLTLIGMPTWENIDLTKAEYKGIEIIYSTPFYNARTDAASKQIISYYSKKMYARPSDLVFRAFGLTYRFGHLLSRYGKSINEHLGGSAYRAFFDMNIQPDYKNGKISHYENKKLYYLKYWNGGLKAVN